MQKNEAQKKAQVCQGTVKGALLCKFGYAFGGSQEYYWPRRNNDVKK
jgi:hypothetical protein